MARPPIIVGPGAGYSFETGARIFAALAFPGLNEDPARVDAEEAWVVSWLHQQNEIDKDDSPFKDERLNRLASRPPKEARAKLRTAMRRFRDRSDIARAVRPWMRELIGSGQHRPINGIKKFTQRQIALWLLGYDEEKAVRFQERVWRLSRPVLHLAVAMDMEAHERALPESNGICLDDLQFFKAIVRRATDLQVKIATDPRFKIDLENQLTIVWKK